MAYLLNDLGKLIKGKKLEINWNYKEYYIQLLKKDDINYSSSSSLKTASFSIKVTDYKTIIIIPEDGFWQLLVRKKNMGKRSPEKFYKVLVTVKN